MLVRDALEITPAKGGHKQRSRTGWYRRTGSHHHYAENDKNTHLPLDILPIFVMSSFRSRFAYFEVQDEVSNTEIAGRFIEFSLDVALDALEGRGRECAKRLPP